MNQFTAWILTGSYKVFMNFAANNIHNYNLLTSSLINCLLSPVQPASQHSQCLAKSQQSIGDLFPIIKKAKIVQESSR